MVPSHTIPLFQKSESRILLGLERLYEVLKFFGHPQSSSESITIAGTVGKGQIATNIAFELSKFGKIALYTSPHLQSFSERIQIIQNGVPSYISDEELSHFSKEVFYAERKLNTELTYFEHATAIAFLWFREKKVDFSVLEIGLGGRLDAVSLARSKVGVISKVHFDHEEFLGNSLEKISYEKALCVPPESVRITLHKAGEPQFVGIQSVSKGRIINGFSWKFLSSSKSEKTPLWDKIYAEVWENETNSHFFVDFTGPHTFFENSVLASFSTLFVLKNFFDIKLDKFSFSIERIKGRFEVRKNIIYDGGHNIASAMALSSAFSSAFPPDYKLNFVFSFKKGKRWRDFLTHLLPRIKRAFITSFSMSEDPYEISDFLKANGIHTVSVFEDHDHLVQNLCDVAKDSSEYICITGTFYIYDIFVKLCNMLGIE